MCFILLDENNVVIQKQPSLQIFEETLGFVEAPDDVVCGMIRNGDNYVLPEPVSEDS